MRAIGMKIGLFTCSLLASLATGQYTPPSARVEPLEPRGIRISIPDEPGISLVAFHVKFNEDFQGLEAGTIARDIVKSDRGRWTYEDRASNKLRLGDIVYYWVHVVYEGLGYNLLDQQHRVTEFFRAEDKNGGRDRGEGRRGECVPSDTRITDPRTGDRKALAVCSGQLLLDETFDNLNRSIWRPIEKFTNVPEDYAFVAYRDDQRNVKCENGNLVIKPTFLSSEFPRDFIRCGNLTLENCTGKRGSVDCQRRALGAYILPPIFSGLIDTRNSLAFTYGKIEIRAKLPRGDWIYPVVSLESLPEQRDEENEANSSGATRLEVASATGNRVLRGPDGRDWSGRVLRGGPVEGSSGGSRGEQTASTAPSERRSDGGTSLWSDDYHVYQLEWGPNRIISRVDGFEYGTVETRPAFRKSFYLKLGLAVGGHERFPDSSISDGYGKPWRNLASKALFDFVNATDLWSKTWDDDSTSLKIDYIKIWAL